MGSDMYKRKSLAFLVLLIFIFTLAVPMTAFAEEGTAENPYLIQDMMDLYNIRENLNAHYKLISDIDLNGMNWVPIGSTDTANSFQGTFDGNNHTISGLYINRKTNYNGLFGRIENAEIKNLGIVNPNIKGGDDTAGLVGSAVNSEITDCYIEGGSIEGATRTGGLVGHVSGTITNCYATGDVTSTDSRTGGLVGYQDSGTITNCYATGDVTSTGSRTTYTGGLVGYVNGTITNCYATGDVTSTSTYGRTGGLVGYQDSGTITNCYATGDVTSTGTGITRTGGLVGYVNDTITNCYATGDVTSTSTDTNSRTGGLVGSGGTITNCYAVGGKVEGKKGSIGGLVGDYSIIKNCYAAKEVIGPNAGGLKGGSNGTVTASYWDVEVSGRTTSKGGKGHTTAEMMQMDTYAFNFFTDWDIEQGESYPWLRSLPKPDEVGGESSATIESITVNPASLNLEPEQTVNLAVSATFSNDSTASVTNEASYESSNTEVVIVDNNKVTAIAIGEAEITVSYLGKTATVPVIVNVVLSDLDSISVNPEDAILAEGETKQLTVTAHYSDETSENVTSKASYESSDPAIVTVENGLITAVSEGEADIAVSYEGKSVIVPVIVGSAEETGPMAEIMGESRDIIVLKTPEHLTPATYNHAAGFTVTENGEDVAVIRVVIKDGTDGWPYSEIWLYLEREVTVGRDIVVEYNADPAEPIYPNDTAGIGTVIIGQDFSVIRDRSGSVWAWGDNTYGQLGNGTTTYSYKSVRVPGLTNVVSIAKGKTHVVTVKDNGTVYTWGGNTHGQLGDGTTIHRYSPVQVPDLYVPAGSSVRATETKTVITKPGGTAVTWGDGVVYPKPAPYVVDNGRTIMIDAPDQEYRYYENEGDLGCAGFRVFSNGKEIPVLAVEVDDEKIILYLGVPIIGGAGFNVDYEPDEDYPLDPGDFGGIGENDSDLAINSLEADPDPTSLEVEEEQQLTVTAHYSDGTDADVTGISEYQIQNAQIASVTETGLIEAISPGETHIAVTYESMGAQVLVIVNEPEVALESISVSPSSVILEHDGSQDLIVTAHYSDGSSEDVTENASYVSANMNVASVDNSKVIAESAGTTEITVTYNDKSKTVPVTVNSEPVILESISVSPSEVTLAHDESQNLVVKAHYSDGSSQTVTNQSSFASDDNDIATVSDRGLVKAVSEGSTQITVSYEGQTKTVPVTVNPAPAVIESLTVNPSEVVLEYNGSQNLTVTAHYSDGSSEDVTGSAKYNSRHIRVASMENNQVNAVNPGTTEITVTYNGKSVIVPVTVKSKPVVVTEIRVRPESIKMLAGNTATLRVTAICSNGSTIDVTSESGFVSLNSEVATVNSSGKVTGVTEGVTSVEITYEGKTFIVPVTIDERGDGGNVAPPPGRDPGSGGGVKPPGDGRDPGDNSGVKPPSGRDDGGNTGGGGVKPPNDGEVNPPDGRDGEGGSVKPPPGRG